MAEEKRRGNGIILYGPSGTGKDHLLVAMAKTAIVDHGLDVKPVFGVDLFSELRDRITDRALEEQWVVRLARPGILILSDPIPPRGPISDYQAALLQRVINKRWNQCKPTWVTLNVESAKQADELLAAAIVDRLKDGAVTAHCDWPSYRRQRRVS
jgi:DNA replication protein DnaC